MPCPPSRYAHPSIPSDPAWCLARIRHLIRNDEIRHIVHFCSVGRTALEGFLEELPAWGINRQFQRQRQLPTVETRLLPVCACRMMHVLCSTCPLISPALEGFPDTSSTSVLGIPVWYLER